MRVSYDKDTDSAYIELSTKKPTGVIEIAEGVNLDTTEANEIVGIEMLNASKKFPIENLFKFEVEQVAEV
jgi:uncharacterized protein YuzE